jgi:hypothetical protein
MEEERILQNMQMEKISGKKKSTRKLEWKAKNEKRNLLI